MSGKGGRPVLHPPTPPHPAPERGLIETPVSTLKRTCQAIPMPWSPLRECLSYSRKVTAIPLRLSRPQKGPAVLRA